MFYVVLPHHAWHYACSHPLDGVGGGHAEEGQGVHESIRYNNKGQQRQKYNNMFHYLLKKKKEKNNV